MNASSPRRVLIVDDDEEVRLAVQLGIALVTDWEARLANHGAEALSSCELWRPEAVVLHTARRDGDEFEVLDALRSDEATGRIPVVLLAAPSTPKEAIDARADDVTGILHEPVDLLSVGAQLAALLHWSASN